MAKLARRFTIISLSMALFAFMFAQLVVPVFPCGPFRSGAGSLSGHSRLGRVWRGFSLLV